MSKTDWFDDLDNTVHMSERRSPVVVNYKLKDIEHLRTGDLRVEEADFYQNRLAIIVTTRPTPTPRVAPLFL